MPPCRFLLSSLLSILILPLLLKLYRGNASSVMSCSSSGSTQSRCSSHSLADHHSSSRRRMNRSPIADDSATLTDLVGSSSSLSRSATPAPSPMLSTQISSGRISHRALSYSALTRPTVSIRSRSRQLMTSNTVLPRRLHRAVRSCPVRLTSRPQIIGPTSVGSTSRLVAAAASSRGMTVSWSLSANSPFTRIAKTFDSSPYWRAMSSMKSGDTRLLSSQLTFIVCQRSAFL